MSSKGPPGVWLCAGGRRRDWGRSDADNDCPVGCGTARSGSSVGAGAAAHRHGAAGCRMRTAPPVRRNGACSAALRDQDARRMGQADGTLRDRHWNRRSSRAGKVSGGRVPRDLARRQRHRGVGGCAVRGRPARRSRRPSRRSGAGMRARAPIENPGQPVSIGAEGSHPALLPARSPECRGQRQR
jgi:hypothetical protein